MSQEQATFRLRLRRRKKCNEATKILQKFPQPLKNFTPATPEGSCTTTNPCSDQLKHREGLDAT